MIEADIVLGTLINDPSGIEQPVMGHPPATTSDISLEGFLTHILQFNNNITKISEKKGVKLDFKSTIVFNGSVQILENLWSQMNYPVWINADILPGPVNNTNTLPVDSNIFLTTCKTKFPSAVLSIGWTTRWGSNFTEGRYEDEHIYGMTAAIKTNKVRNPLTFPVRAGIAANSKMDLQNLCIELNETNNITLTIWSSKNDFVDIKKLQDLILTFGLDKVYLDVPEEVSNQLDLSGSGNSVFSRTWMGICFVMLNIFLYRFLHNF